MSELEAVSQSNHKRKLGDSEDGNEEAASSKVAKVDVSRSKSTVESLKALAVSKFVEQAEGLLKEGKVIHVYDDTSVEDAYRTLAAARIHSAPVISKTLNLPIGLVDVLDVVEAVVLLFRRVTAKDLLDDEAPVYFEKEAELGALSATAIKDISTRNPWKPIYSEENRTLYDVAKLMAEENVHRIPVLSKKDPTSDFYHISSLISQSAVVKYVYDHANEVLGERKNIVVKYMVQTRKMQLVKILQTQSALSAFRLMREKRVSTVAVVNESGELVESISASDLKLWNEWILGNFSIRFRSLSSLGKSVHDFLEDLRYEQGYDDEKKYHSIATCLESSTLFQVLEQIVQFRIHHVYVVDDARVPLRIISLRDILAEVLDEPSQQ